MSTPSQTRDLCRHRFVLVLLLSPILAPVAAAQTAAGEGPRFGVSLPPVFEPHRAPAIGRRRLERMARFLAFFIKQVDHAPLSQINP